MSVSSGTGAENLSPTMQELNKLALQRARKMIAEKFKTPQNLDEVPIITFNLQKQMTAAETQLSGAVQGKLDALKRAVDLMDESAEKLKVFTATMKKVDERIKHANTQLIKYENLKRVDNLRDNLEKVLSLIDRFVRIPQSEFNYRVMLENEPSRLKEVFLGSVSLDSFRMALMKETNSTHEQDLQDFIKEKLASTLAQDIANRAIENLCGAADKGNDAEDFFDMAMNKPADLVMTFEVIKMHQDYYNRRKQQLLGKARKGGTKDEQKENRKLYKEIEQFEVYNMLERAHDALKERMEVRVANIFKAVTDRKDERVRLAKQIEHLTQEAAYAPSGDEQDDLLETIRLAQERLEEAGGKYHALNATIEGADQAIRFMGAIKAEVEPCAPPEFDLVHTYFQVFSAYLGPEIANFCLVAGDPHEITTGDLLNLIDWLQFFLTQMEEDFDLLDQPCCDDFAQHIRDLVTEYLRRTKAQMTNWFDNIRKQKFDIVVTTEGLATTNPEDMFNVVLTQFDVAKENLQENPSVLKDVASACLQVMRDIQRVTRDTLENGWAGTDDGRGRVTAGMDVETLCATINDNARMHEKCMEFKEVILSMAVDDDGREALEDILDQLSEEYTHLALDAVSYVARVVLEDLMEPVFALLFTPAWEKGEALSQVATATLLDYFKDMAKWLHPFFYPKFVHQMLCKVTAYYVMSIRKKVDFESQITAHQMILRDQDAFVEFFDEYAEELRKSGMEGPRQGQGQAALSIAFGELKYLSCLAEVVVAEHISGSKDSIESMLVKWGPDGLKLIFAAIQSNPTLRGDKTAKAAKQAFIDAVAQKYEMGTKKGAYGIVESEEFASLVADVGVDVSAAVSKAPKPRERGFFSWAMM